MRIVNKTFLISASAGLLGLALILIATSRYGVGLSADSVTYLSTAQNLLSGRGYTSFDGSPLLVFPPLFSTLIAVAGAGWLTPQTTARWINAVCFSIVIFLSTRWLIKRTSSVLLAMLGVSVILSSVALIEVSVYAWSEPLFILFTLLALLLLQRFESDNSASALIIGGVCSALACVTRYAGITIVLTGAVLILTKKRSPVIDRMRWAIYFLCASLLPLALWCFRNYMVSSTLTGDRATSKSSLGSAIYQVGDVISLWILPNRVPTLVRIIAVALFLSAIVLIYMAQEKWRDEVYDLWIREMRSFFVFIGIYILFMVFTTTSTALSPIDNRYMSPIFVPLVLSVVLVIDKIIRQYSALVKRDIARIVLNVLIMAWLAYPIYTVAQTVRSYLIHGAGGFHTPEWATSEVIDYLKEHALSGAVYSNEPYAIYALTGKVSYESPRKNKYESSTKTDDLVYFQKELQEHGSVYLVWFNTSWWREYLYDVDELSKSYSSEIIVSRKDGAIYLVRPRALPCCVSMQPFH